MTWGKATPVLVVAAVFDALRLLCEFLWFFGPAIAAIACTAGVNNFLGATISGVIGKAVAAGCGLAAAAAGVIGIEVTGPLSIVMADAVGFMGWLVVGALLLTTNPRIFKENLLWIVGSLFASEIPFVGALPALTVAVWRMYRNQIKTEKAELADWEKKNAAAQLQERNQRAAQVIQIQAMQQAQFEEQEAEEEEMAEQQAESDEEFAPNEIPEPA